MLIDDGQFGRTTDEGTVARRQIVLPGIRCGGDLAPQLLGGRHGLDAKFLLEQHCQAIVLPQSIAALALVNQQTHALLVGLLAPGLHFNLPPHGLLGRRIIAPPLVKCGQLGCRGQCGLAQVFTLGQ